MVLPMLRTFPARSIHTLVRSTSSARRLLSGVRDPPSSAAPVSKKEMAVLRQEIQELQAILKQQNRNYDAISQQVQAQSTHMEKAVMQIHERVALVTAPLESISKLTNAVQNNEAFLNLIHRFERYSRGWLNRYTLATLGFTIIVIWRYRATMYERTSEEMADIASRTLRQEGLQESIQETLSVIANSPTTLETLNELLQTMLRDPVTLKELLTLIRNALEEEEVRTSLLELLAALFANPDLQKQVGEFLLLGLDEEGVKKMLEDQTQALVRTTVLDPSVQQATGVGVKQSLWYSLTPSFLWPKTGVLEQQQQIDDSTSTA
jgi:hypothetical protein